MSPLTEVCNKFSRWILEPNPKWCYSSHLVPRCVGQDDAKRKAKSIKKRAPCFEIEDSKTVNSLQIACSKWHTVNTKSNNDDIEVAIATGKRISDIFHSHFWGNHPPTHPHSHATPTDSLTTELRCMGTELRTKGVPCDSLCAPWVRPVTKHVPPKGSQRKQLNTWDIGDMCIYKILSL